MLMAFLGREQSVPLPRSRQGRYFYIGAWAALGPESCEAPGARCGSTY
jgi:hypothetical protein